MCVCVLNIPELSTADTELFLSVNLLAIMTHDDTFATQSSTLNVTAINCPKKGGKGFNT